MDVKDLKSTGSNYVDITINQENGKITSLVINDDKLTGHLGELIENLPLLDSISGELAKLNSTASYDGEVIAISIAQEKGVLNKNIVVDESKIKAIKEKTDLIEVSTDENNNKTINISTPISANSISANSISSPNTIVADDFKTSQNNITLSGVSDRIDKIDTLITADKETYIDNVTEIIEFFKNVPEESVGMEIFNQVNANKGDITEIRTDISNLDTKDNGAHQHTYTPSGSIESTFSPENHNHSFTGTANQETSDTGAHQHTYTPVGNITLSGILNDGVLKIEAIFTGTESVVGSAGSHKHTYTAAGTISETAATGAVESTFTGTEITTSENGTHNHEVYIKTTNTKN